MNLAERIQSFRYRRLDALRLARVLLYLEKRALRKTEIMQGTQQEAADALGISKHELRVQRARVQRLIGVGVLLLMVGCVTKQPLNVRSIPSPPPLPRMMESTEVMTMTTSEAVGPPSYPRLALFWESHSPVTEVWSSTNLFSWTLATTTTNSTFPFFASKSREFFKIRHVEIIGNITNYSTWAQ